MGRENKGELPNGAPAPEGTATANKPGADTHVERVLGQVEEFARTGEDRPIARPPPLPTEATGAAANAGADEALPEERSEHWDAVQPAKTHEVQHPDKKVVIREQRTLSEVAADAGLSLVDFKALSAGDRRARTMLAVRLVDQLGGGAQRPAHSPRNQAAAPPTRKALGGSAGSGGADLLDALPALDADGSVVAGTTPSPPAAVRPAPRNPQQGADLLGDLPSLEADGSVLELGDAPPHDSDSALLRRGPSIHGTAGATTRLNPRLRSVLLAVAAIVALVVLLLVVWLR
jgi:hypothetical protein